MLFVWERNKSALTVVVTGNCRQEMKVETCHCSSLFMVSGSPAPAANSTQQRVATIYTIATRDWPPYTDQDTPLYIRVGGPRLFSVCISKVRQPSRLGVGTVKKLQTQPIMFLRKPGTLRHRHLPRWMPQVNPPIVEWNLLFNLTLRYLGCCMPVMA